MPEDTVRSSKRALDPIERVSEILFGLIMVLTFTGSLSVAEAGRESIRTMLVGALGCNLAWGIIDAALYLMGSVAERGKALLAWHAVRKATDPQESRRVLAEALPALVTSVLRPAELDAICQRMKGPPEPPDRVSIHADDWRGASAVFLLVFLSTFPVVIPFTFMEDARAALRVSNGVAVVMLFLTGYVFGRITGRRPWMWGLAMVVVGATFVGMTIALGG